jgi:hypothetical protein
VLLYAEVSVLLCLAITQVIIPSITQRACPAPLTITLTPIQPLATTLVADTTLPRHFRRPYSTLFKTPYWGYMLSFGFLNPEDRTDRLSRNVGKKHYSLRNNPEERSFPSSQVLFFTGSAFITKEIY